MFLIIFFLLLCRRSRSLVPKSSYYFGPPGPDTAYGTAPVGQIGVHHPREILRVERDYTGGELIQFAPIYPIELDGRVSLCFSCLLMVVQMAIRPLCCGTDHTSGR
jgi:hypothetical protein